MSEKKFYCICDMGCKYETLNREQILTAITQAVSEGTIRDIDTGFVTTLKTINGKSLKFFVGEQSEYEALTEAERDDLFAIITNDTSKEAFENALVELQKSFDAGIKALGDGSLEVAKAKKATSATSATTVNAEKRTVELTWNGESATADVEFDANSIYVITTSDGTGAYFTVMLHILENELVQASFSEYNRHNLVFYNSETKKLSLRRYFFIADETHEVGFVSSYGSQTATYTKIANLTEQGAQ